MNNNWQYIYPVNEAHILEGLLCTCNPEIDWKNNLVIHNAFNYREFIEEAEEIIK